MRELKIEELESVSGGKDATNVKNHCPCGPRKICGCQGYDVSYDGGKTWETVNF